MKRFWSGRIQNAVPYTPGEQPRGQGLIKLNTNECPYPPSPKVTEAVSRAAGDSLRLYPDPECLELRAAIAKREGLDVSQVFCGNGSDEVLAFAFQAFFDPDRPVVFPRNPAALSISRWLFSSRPTIQNTRAAPAAPSSSRGSSSWKICLTCFIVSSFPRATPLM